MTDLSALEVPPAGTEEYFGAAYPAAVRYAQHLATTGIEWGLIGPREIDRLWTRHILNCAVVAEFIDDSDVVGDVGSGAGLPGIPIALLRPQAQVVLIEPMERRVEWLKMVIDDLGLDNVRIVRARVEELVDEEMFTVVTARAVKAMTTLIEWTHEVMGPDGRILALKGASVEAELAKTKKLLKRYRLTQPTIHVIDGGILDVPSRVVEIAKK
ncbi:MAG: 16S rRNA (guanine(527)-N(7))-methyltransferase RsmG [Brevibacterium sp.]|uniref:16S rRNA (guanine(527)-N(7))-methyltransferase RsmG n=1 Tax=Brevibacterium sp. TaxID=1701 RepID=UPI002649CDDC|nr:16S rRNA (guanine(527)-N(7))-methyltransferase RsmG [Brevibacterium sp.]MDN5806312.1 16S rRNA (guanine(527)-N(7))-methyltransferase RsmG [Brevibacterium sp.]MDN5834049.1 16S rRNA (guanine(527)-N(7))-methyltransferase RsmG [Brevibacterium sp.]MDN5875614.1 16S rRNA (guanine(527)-N(7))-methyltransferase RsmG [Brevibacterium sp.]MDN5908972.1 16S rRNA (guanine(527)-N(7))-methyltransferase RsmG [Brevibacterium sp.]MDN6122276.1 16S rRNA (guanine(527)-N(7))-methyltransferase RsmG [Brevibacterium sp